MTKTESGIFYPDIPPEQASPEQREKCLLDLSYPVGKSGFPVIIWFHGGGFTEGSRGAPEGLHNHGYGVVAAGYRLAPTVSCPAYIEDGAAAVAWVFNNIARYGGDPDKIFIAGRSAGGYLAAILGMDKRWLNAHGIDANRCAGIIPMTGQMSTHFHIRAERGDTEPYPVIDDMAPMRYIRKDAPPIFLITGDRELDIPARVEENILYARLLKVNGHPDVTMRELKGLSHDMTAKGVPLILQWLDGLIAGKNPDSRLRDV